MVITIDTVSTVQEIKETNNNSDLLGYKVTDTSGNRDYNEIEAQIETLRSQFVSTKG